MLKRAQFSKGFIFPYFLDRLFTLGVLRSSANSLFIRWMLSRALESLTYLVVERIFLGRFLLTMHCLEKVCNKIDGTSNTLLSTREHSWNQTCSREHSSISVSSFINFLIGYSHLEFNGGLQKTFSFVESSWRHSRTQQTL
jgi:hypothetical protein